MAARFTLHHGDCLQVLRGMGDASVDAIVCDPPAGIAFMGKDWDKDKGGRDAWIAWMQSVAQECLRVIKHGGHALVWALPRTSHWTGMAWENAGWEPRDKIMHLFGTGFPKSLNVSKAINRAAGAERPVVGKSPWSQPAKSGPHAGLTDNNVVQTEGRYTPDVTTPATDAAKEWEGWGTALKPAAEDWWLLRKPLDGTVAANVLKHGTGALNIDGCRVEVKGGWEAERGAVWMRSGNEATSRDLTFQGPQTIAGPLSERLSPLGRFPANLMHDGSDEVVAGFPQSEASVGTYRREQRQDHGGVDFGVHRPAGHTVGFGDSGSAARFFYCTKASRRDREEGCEHLEAKSGAEAVDREEGSAGMDSPRAGASRTAGKVKNHHPTVKNTELMRYLCRLVTPPNGVVLDPFMGSGSTGKGCMYEGFRFIGIDQDPEYVEIARARIEYALRNGGFVDEVEVKPAPKAGSSLKVLRRKVSDEQIDLFAQPIAQDEEPT